MARRLLDAGRVDEAFDIIACARAADETNAFRSSRSAIDAVYEECLEKQGMLDELKKHLWETFEQTLSASSLRKYLKLLPDFDDIEAEEKALDYAEAYPHLGAVLSFLIDWPAHGRAAQVVFSRADEHDGNSYYTLTNAAEVLEAEHPLAATLVRRAMLRDTLDGAKSKRYRYAARHLAECQSSDATIGDYGDNPAHAEFVEELRQKHGRKYGFWHLVDGQ